MSQNTQPPVNLNRNYEKEDDIDLLGLLRALLKTWKVWVIALVVVSAVFGGLKALQILATTPETVFSKPIRLTFPEAHNLRFPSGARFVHSDIVSSSIAQQIFERNHLDNYGLTVADFQGGLSATPYSPEYPLIVERYTRMMSDKKLTADQIANLQQTLDKELQQATSGEVLLSWRLDKHEVPRAVAEKVLSDIPALWAEQAIKEKGVLEMNAQLVTENALNVGLIAQEEVLVAGDLLKEKMKILNTYIARLNQFEGAQSIRDPKSGMRLIDLGYALEDLEHYVLSNLIAPVRIQGLTREPDIFIYFHTDKLNKLRLQLTALERQAAAIKDSYNSYIRSERVSNNDNGSAQMLAPQFNADMLDKLANMTGGAARETYKQELNDRWLALTSQITETENQITDVETQLAAVKKAMTESKDGQSNLYMERAQSRLPGIVKEISEKFGVAERIYQQMRAETTGVKEQLYIPVTNRVSEQKQLINVKSTLLSWIALMFLTSVLVIPSTMIRNALKHQGSK